MMLLYFVIKQHLEASRNSLREYGGNSLPPVLRPLNLDFMNADRIYGGCSRRGHICITRTALE